jgi:hypothetical protein
MLALVVTMVLRCASDVECKGERVCVDGRCVAAELVPQREAERLPQEAVDMRPSLRWPLLELILGAVAMSAGALASIFTGTDDALFAGLGVGGALLFGGGVSLGTTLWARGR